MGGNDFYDYGSEVLYQSSNLSVVKTLAILFTWFSSFPGISKEAFGRLLYVLNNFILPKDNKLPDSSGKALTMIKHLLVSLEEHDSCVNDCVVFRKCGEGDFTRLTHCPKCNSDRYEPNTAISRKKFKYIPIGPRLKRMFSDKTVSKLLQSHLQQPQEQTNIADLHQSEAWISSYGYDGQFGGDPRGISLSFCTDGTNPFSKERVSYSMWPITLSVLNLPFGVRNNASSLMLAGIIPGKSEPKFLDPYIEVFVDEIRALQGLDCYDAYRNENFKLNINILMNVLDYPGQNNCVGK